VKRKYRAFTLIEMLVVIVIIGILATLIIFALRSAVTRARDAKAKAAVKQIQTVLEMYQTDYGNFDGLSNCLNTFCDITSEFAKEYFVDRSGSRYLNMEAVDGQGDNIRFMITGGMGSEPYIIQGKSAGNASKCWKVGSGRTNIDKVATQCD